MTLQKMTLMFNTRQSSKVYHEDFYNVLSRSNKKDESKSKFMKSS